MKLQNQHDREIQPFGTLRNLPITLASAACSESCKQLNQILADSLILDSLYKKPHWLMQGNTFYQLHLLLDKHADEQLKLIDSIGEGVQTLGCVPIADPRHVAEVTKIERPPNGVEEIPVMLSRLLEAHELIQCEVREEIAQTAANRDDGTSDLLTSEVLRTNESQAWFLAEHIVEHRSFAAKFLSNT
jgi:starvation-inducible DNA-binding protein